MSGVIAEEENKDNNFKDHAREMEKTLQILENNIKESNEAHSQVITSLHNDKIMYQGMSNQLNEALKENQQLLSHIINEKSGDTELMRTNSQVDLSPSYSTMSIVHLQYRYEELLASHHGLLKLLESKSSELKKIADENTQLRLESDKMMKEISTFSDRLSKKQAKFSRIKERKDEKIRKLKAQKETLQMVHNQLIGLLGEQCTEKNKSLSNEIRNCSDPDKALLLQEVRKNNMLTYENFYLTQETEYLKSRLLSIESKFEK